MIEHPKQLICGAHRLNKTVRARTQSVPSSLPVSDRSHDVVFIVNGRSEMRAELERVICTSGLTVVSFNSAAEYLAFPNPEHAACLILDVLLPDVNGLDMYQGIAKECAPVVFVTRQPSIASSVRALKCGAIDFLAFPFAPEDLLHAVHIAVDRNRSLRVERESLAELQHRLARVTPREREVLALVASGLRNKQVAVALGISLTTVQIHRGSLMRKMKARSFANLVRIADALQISVTDTPRFNTEFRSSRADIGATHMRVHFGSYQPAP